MTTIHTRGIPLEDLVAELTDAAYRVALRHGLHGPFVDVELELWRELRQVLLLGPLAGRGRLDSLVEGASRWQDPSSDLSAPDGSMACQV